MNENESGRRRSSKNLFLYGSGNSTPCNNLASFKFSRSIFLHSSALPKNWAPNESICFIKSPLPGVGPIKTVADYNVALCHVAILSAIFPFRLFPNQSRYHFISLNYSCLYSVAKEAINSIIVKPKGAPNAYTLFFKEQYPEISRQSNKIWHEYFVTL